MLEDPSKIIRTVQQGFPSLRVIVAGDLMLDRYMWGRVERISPEAPVPVVRLSYTSHAMGGAANVAANLGALGCRVSISGVLGADDDGRQLFALLNEAGIETKDVVRTPDRPTICKTRIIGGQQQMLRLDVEKTEDIKPDVRKSVLAGIERQLSGASVLILSDYGKGLLDDSLCRTLIGLARELSIPVFVDPKGLSYEKYRGCSVISPNRVELTAATSTQCSDLEALLSNGEKLRAELEIGAVMVTLGELGIALLDHDGIHRFPATAREVYDVSGAGDTVIATVAAGVAAGLDPHEAIRLANVAAGIVIGKVGTVPVTRDELLARLMASEEAAGKIFDLNGLLQRIARCRASGQRIVFTNGCFDLLHVGHLSLLEQAKKLGDCLIVALNTDRSIRAIKGSGQPVVSQEARARLLSALPCVDAVVLFDEETPLKLIQALRPNVLVKGGDYAADEVVGASEVKSWGGRVALVPLVEGFSTTALLRRAHTAYGDSRRETVS